MWPLSGGGGHGALRAGGAAAPSDSSAGIIRFRFEGCFSARLSTNAPVSHRALFRRERRACHPENDNSTTCRHDDDGRLYEMRPQPTISPRLPSIRLLPAAARPRQLRVAMWLSLLFWMNNNSNHGYNVLLKYILCICEGIGYARRLRRWWRNLSLLRRGRPNFRRCFCNLNSTKPFALFAHFKNFSM